MSMTEVKSNTYNYTRKKLSADQVLVTNNLGYTIVYGEFVVLGGYFGFVEEPGGIANGATGYISIMPFEVMSEQVEGTDTFTAGNTLYFEPGSGVAGTFVDTATGTTTAVGIITGEVGTGGAQTAVSFVPFLQKVNNSGLDTRLTAAEAAIAVEQAEPKIFVQKVTTGGAAIAVTGLVEGDEIIDVQIIPTGASANGTITIQDGAANAITDAMTCAVDKTIARASSIDDDYSTLPATGALIVCAGDVVASTVAIVIFTYIPA